MPTRRVWLLEGGGWGIWRKSEMRKRDTGRSSGSQPYARASIGSGLKRQHNNNPSHAHDLFSFNTPPYHGTYHFLDTFKEWIPPFRIISTQSEALKLLICTLNTSLLAGSTPSKCPNKAGFHVTSVSYTSSRSSGERQHDMIYQAVKKPQVPGLRYLRQAHSPKIETAIRPRLRMC